MWDMGYTPALQYSMYIPIFICNLVEIHAIHEKVPGLSSQFRQKPAWKEVGSIFAEMFLFSHRNDTSL